MPQTTPLSTLLRMVRAARRLSQRELAKAAKMPRSTIDRIESGAIARPRFDTIEQILHSTGYALVIIDATGRRLAFGPDWARPRDRGGRSYPAHLPRYPVVEAEDGWWGWRRIAWQMSDPIVPEWTYVQRPRRWPDEWAQRWDDAT